MGRSLARLFAENSWTVAVSSRTAADLISLQGEFEAKRIRTYPLDVSDLGATINVVDQIEKEIGIPDLVILNAGTHVAISVETFSAEKVRDLMEVNFMG
ncbi:MAG: SDR family NAD(P)-dependent oxidoreductase, partial [Pseudomonadota bacterium]|nr:SDR family NAD(P)-dependent oxidoreductase [Pseudomonadota bacterium]